MGATVLLVDDHAVLRKGLRLLLEAEPDIRVIGEAGDGHTALELVRNLSPDVVVMDITMPELDGIEATRHITSMSSSTKVVALSIHSGRHFVENMLGAGAVGYILKESAPEELIDGLRTVMRGDYYLSPAITGIVVSQFVRILSGGRLPAPREPLTAGEVAVIESVVAGRSIARIASDMQAAPETIETAYHAIQDKLGIHDEAALADLVNASSDWASRREASEAPQPQEPARSQPTRDSPVVTVEPIIRTKLNRPPVPPDLVVRSRLLEWLEQHHQQPLTLISAPAGYGKSTLASSWLEAVDRPGAWLSLDDDDNDPLRFLTGFVAALETALPSAGQETRALLDAPIAPPWSVLLRTLLDDLNAIDEPFIIVLDDYHLIHQPDVHELVSELLRHPPHAMQLALLTRKDPPLPLSPLRGRGQVTEIAVLDLRFSSGETAEFLQNALSISVDRATAGVLETKIEGWPAGLRLVAHSLKHRNDLDQLMAGLQGSFSAVIDYLLAEVLSRQPPAITAGLLKTSILDRFCAPLCDALLAGEAVVGEAEIDGKGFTAWLRTNNLFLITLDTEGHWFRYHHLFRQLLRNRLGRQLGRADIRTLHARASVWLGQSGMLEAAMQHALEAGDDSYAVGLLEQARWDLMNREEWNRLDRCLDRLPRSALESSPALLISKAWVCEFRSRIREMLDYLDRAEALAGESPAASPEGQAVRAEIDTLAAIRLYYEWDGEGAAQRAERALRTLSPQLLSIRADAALILALAHQMKGDTARGLEVLYDELDRVAPRSGAYRARLLAGFCFVHWNEGDLTSLMQAGLGSMRLGEELGLADCLSVGRYFVSIAHYSRNELEAAEPYLAAAVRDRYLARPHYFAMSAFAQALCHTAAGQHDEADRVAELVVTHAIDSENTLIMQTARAFQAELALRQGRKAAAFQWLTGSHTDLFEPLYLFYLPQLTRAKALIAMETPESLAQAGVELAQLRERAEATHNARVQIDVLALEALLHDTQGEEAEALDRLRQSLELAEPGGFVRPYLDLGPPLATLLYRLGQQDVAMPAVRRLLTAFRDESGLAVPELSESGVTSRSPSGSEPLIEPLTTRELSVLALLAKHLQNKEIATKLFVSPETVKTHLKNIYQKLNVTGRRAAVRRAVALGVLARPD